MKRQPDGPLDAQFWDAGTLIDSHRIEVVPRCALQHEGQAWMFHSDECLNGLAHGEGLAVSEDGGLIIPRARIVLGKIVRGDAIEMPDENQLGPGREGG